MRLPTIVVMELLVCLPLGAGPEGFPVLMKSSGRFVVEVVRLDWTDALRGRQVPAKVYCPKADPGPFPVIIFSHGLGGSRESYEYLGRHWASHGYASVHLQHIGSDDTVWRDSGQPMNAMKDAAAGPQNAVNRSLDVRFALDRLAQLNAEAGLLRGRLDLQRVGVAGHSFGAFTTLAVGGQLLGPAQRRLADDRVKAAIAMSAPVPRRNADRAFGQIRIPILHMTGTEDDSPIGATTAAERRIPFDRISGADQYLLSFTGGDHSVFTGRRGRRGDGSRDATFHDLIRMSTTAFWNAYLRDDTRAKQWLAERGLEAALGKAGALERKPAVSRASRPPE